MFAPSSIRRTRWYAGLPNSSEIAISCYCGCGVAAADAVDARRRLTPGSTEGQLCLGTERRFCRRQEPLNELLKYWEREMTDAAIDAARQFAGTPAERILYLMETVMTGNHARYDLPIWHWAQSDTNRVFKGVLKKRLSFAAWVFSEVGFSAEQAEVRGRMMVIYMMGESTLIPGDMARSQELLKLKHTILVAPE